MGTFLTAVRRWWRFAYEMLCKLDGGLLAISYFLSLWIVDYWRYGPITPTPRRKHHESHAESAIHPELVRPVLPHAPSSASSSSTHSSTNETDSRRSSLAAVPAHGSGVHLTAEPDSIENSETVGKRVGPSPSGRPSAVRSFTTTSHLSGPNETEVKNIASGPIKDRDHLSFVRSQFQQSRSHTISEGSHTDQRRIHHPMVRDDFHRQRSQTVGEGRDRRGMNSSSEIRRSSSRSPSTGSRRPSQRRQGSDIVKEMDKAFVVQKYVHAILQVFVILLAALLCCFWLALFTGRLYMIYRPFFYALKLPFDLAASVGKKIVRGSGQIAAISERWIVS